MRQPLVQNITSHRDPECFRRMRAATHAWLCYYAACGVCEAHPVRKNQRAVRRARRNADAAQAALADWADNHGYALGILYGGPEEDNFEHHGC